MSKKQSKIKKVKKAVKPVKTKSASKKIKSVKSAPTKKLVKKIKKVVAKKSIKKIEKKKTAVKKAIKPIKKAVAKKITPKKIVKPVKKNSVKKTTLLLVEKTKKPAIKPAKKADNLKLNNKIDSKKAAKEEKLAKKITAVAKKVELPKVEKVKKLKDKPVKSKGGRKPKGNGDDDEPEIIHDELVEQLIRSTKKLRAQPKKPRIIQTFTNPRASLAAVLPESNNKKSAPLKKEPKGKFELEYVAHTSSGILYEFLTTPSGLSEWFADDVNIQDGIFTFFWDGSEQKAKLLSFKEEKHVRFQWFDKPDGTYFEFRIERDELTGDISLLITDFADEATDMQTSKLLWDSQINKLLHVIGSY